VPELVTHKGGCHCGAVRFEVRAPAEINATHCNCSICQKSGYLHLSVARDAFTLVQGEDNLTTYRFNTGVAEHYFCKTCGIKSFYKPRSRPDGLSVNVNCLDPGTVASVTIREFDGQRWEAAMASRPPVA
jgi:hypothetical protein